MKQNEQKSKISMAAPAAFQGGFKFAAGPRPSGRLDIRTADNARGIHDLPRIRTLRVREDRAPAILESAPTAFNGTALTGARAPVWLGCLTVVLALLMAVSGFAGSHTWTGAAADGYWSTPANWLNNAPPLLGETSVSLHFPSGPARRDTTNNIGGLVVKSISLDGASYYFASYQGRGITLDAGTILTGSGTHYIREGFPITLNGSCSFTVASNATLFARCVLTGPGGFTKFADGSLYLDGDAPNTYAGTTTVYDGRLIAGASHLSGGQTVPDVTIPGAVVIGSSADVANVTPELRLSFSEQIANNASVTVNPKGKLNLNGWNERIATLAVSGGLVESGAGILEINGDVSAIAPYLGVNTASIAGQLHLGSLPRSFNVGPGLTLSVPANIRGGNFGNLSAGITKIGPGQLLLSGANTFTGLVAVVEGSLDVQHSKGLGATNGYTSVASNATLSFGGGAGTNIVGELLHLNGGGRLRAIGDAAWDGAMTLDGPGIVDVPNTNHTMTIGGTIDGPGGIQKTGKGELLFSGAGNNTYTGATFVNAGTLSLHRTWVFGPYLSVSGPLIVGTDLPNDPLSYVRLLVDDQIATNAPVTVRASGRLLLQDHTQALSSLGIHGGAMDTGPNGLLRLEGALTSSNSVVGGALLQGQVELGNAPRTVQVDGNPLNLAAELSGGYLGRLIKTGAGNLRLTVANRHLAETVVTAGSLTVEHNDALGATNSGWGVSVESGASLVLPGNIELPIKKSIHLTGDGVAEGYGALRCVGGNTIHGTIRIEGAARIQVIGNGELIARRAFTSFVGDTLIKGGTGTLLIQAEGTGEISGHSGETVIDEGPIALDWFRNNQPSTALRGNVHIGGGPGRPPGSLTMLRNYQIDSTTAAVHVDLTGRLILSSNTKTHVDRLSGKGMVEIGAGAQLTLGPGEGGAECEFGGVLMGGDVDAENVQKMGGGLFRFSGSDLTKGRIRIYGGTFLANSYLPDSRIRVDGAGTLGGTGTVGFAEFAGGRLDPGDPVGGLRVWQTAVLSSNRLLIDVHGAVPGYSHDQLSFDQALDLSKTYLEPCFGGGFYPAAGQQFTILRNYSGVPVAGTFVGLPEGAIWRPIPSVRLRVNYNVGPAKDVVLTVAEPPAPSQVSSIVYNAGLPSIVVGTGLPGDTYDVEANDNLNNADGWILLGQTTAGANGAMHFVDSDAPNHPQRFYRFVLR